MRFFILFLTILVIQNSADAEKMQGDQGCKEFRADVFFALDTSSSININNPDNFQKELDLVNEFIKKVEIGETKVQVGLLTFSTDAEIQFFLNKYHSKEELKQGIKEKSYTIKGDTYINEAIDMIIQDGFNQTNGMRPDVPHIMVMVTDGRSTRQSFTNKAIERLKKTNITTFSVGAGSDVSMDELHKIASTDDNVFYVTDLSKLDGIKGKLVEHICAESPEEEEVPQKEEECKETKADIMFLIDSSSSLLTPETFQKELKFVVNVIDGLPIAPDEVRVGAMQFSNETKIKLEIGIGDINDKQELAEAVLNIQWMGGNTFLDKALERILVEMRPEKLRIGIPHIVILISDGVSTNPSQTRLQMEQIREKTDIIFIAIGVGRDRNMKELESLATRPIKNHVFEVENQDALEGIRSKLLTTVCQADRPAAEVCANEKADIIFLADLSTSIGHQAFAELKVFILEVVKKFPIGSDSIQIGLITFSTDAKTEFKLNEYMNFKEIETAIVKVQYTTGDTNTHLAFDEMLNHGFIISAGVRSGVPKIGILITDGNSREPQKTLERANTAKEKLGITLFCIGVGPYYNKTELESIASMPLDKHIFMVDDYSSLDNIENDVASRACTAEANEKELENTIDKESNNFIAKKKGNNGWDVGNGRQNFDRSKIESIGHRLRGESDDQNDRYTNDIRGQDYEQRNSYDKKYLLSLLKRVLEKENERRNNL